MAWWIKNLNNHDFSEWKGWENQKEEDQKQVKDFEGNGFRGKQEPEN